MSDLCREQHPLLCDDYSDEDVQVKNYTYNRRYRPAVCRERARNYAKGATAIISRWPDHCATSVAYWWLGVIMITLTIFVIYNSVLIFGMIPPTYLKQPKYRIFNNAVKSTVQPLPDVYMHLIINNNTNIHLNRYLPHIDAISKKYPSFKYRFLAVINDTTQDVFDFSDHQRNDIAFNSLWAHHEVNSKISKKYNISVEYISLTTYLNNSPIKKVWRQLPSFLIEFLVRSISIWDKGGIAFNPMILTSKSPDPNYLEKLYALINEFVISNNTFVEIKPKDNVRSDVSSQKPNNIQDILNALDKEDGDFSKDDLNVAENKVAISTNTENIFQSKLVRELKNKSIRHSKENKTSVECTRNLNEKEKSILKSTNQTKAVDNMLPLFLKYLFNNNPKQATINNSNIIDLKISNTNEILHKGLISSEENKSTPIKKELIRNDSVVIHDEYKSINLNNVYKNNADAFFSTSKNHDNIQDLSLDLKGNIIASKTACHAFLGTVFSNVIHHANENTLTDFIITEISLFCNEPLTTCAGINVILV